MGKAAAPFLLLALGPPSTTRSGLKTRACAALASVVSEGSLVLVSLRSSFMGVTLFLLFLDLELRLPFFGDLILLDLGVFGLILRLRDLCRPFFGDLNLRCLGDLNLPFFGDLILLFLGDLNLRLLGDINLRCLGDLNLRYLGDLTLLRLGDLDLPFVGDLTWLALGDLTFFTGVTLLLLFFPRRFLAVFEVSYSRVVAT